MDRHTLRLETTVRQYLIRNTPYNNEEHKQKVYDAINTCTIQFEVDLKYAYVYLNKDKFVIPMKLVWDDLPVFKAIDGEITSIKADF